MGEKAAWRARGGG